MPYRLLPTFQTYSWGDDSFIQNLCSLEDREGTPLAEMWLGAHPKAPSTIQLAEKHIPLHSYIAANPAVILGDAKDTFEGALPFLLKVLAAKEPLSIQVHPDKETAKLGFAEENRRGIALDDSKRTFKDSNHKPELMCALTDFTALCGFRAYGQIIANITSFKLEHIWEGFSAFSANPNANTLQGFFKDIMTSDELQLHDAVNRIVHFSPASGTELHELKELCLNLMEKYRYDAGVVSPLLLNYVKLKAFDAIYIEAGILHAYLNGAGLELMANSDNVIRGGLSPKHIDLERLFAISSFQPYIVGWVQVQKHDDSSYVYITPAKEFSFSLIELKGEYLLPSVNKPRIMLCLHGTFNCNDDMILSMGEAIFCDASEAMHIKGKALVAVASA
ncbi:MAG: mannose-6-phosphate isomerase, class I [Candidatus Cloacimonetes bacterium HGW-Cloacimonetes-3]|jgi:mannose-6-phosphate isomerase|nr:MAG: mannose-6-phosphate isomerase, class I [Candidatus Cloacimonetes bacterium HGW-Cloacimonetes-3]